MDNSKLTGIGRIFSIIALLVLGMACVNFTNLATARASQRAREVARQRGERDLRQRCDGVARGRRVRRTGLPHERERLLPSWQAAVTSRRLR